MIRKQSRYFKKPDEICLDIPDRWKEAMALQGFEFIQWFYDDIYGRVKQEGLTLRGGTLVDIPKVKNFIEAHYTRLEGNSLTTYDYYRFTEYGNTLIVEKGDEILGSIFEIGYDTAERTSYAMRFVVAPRVRGTGVARVLADMTALKAIERGSRVLRATIAIRNYVSLFFHINKVGMVIEALNPEIQGLTRYYQASLPATKEGILTNRIDRLKLMAYLQSKKEGLDYRLIDAEDDKKIEQALVQDNYKFVAFWPMQNKRYSFVALPCEEIFLVGNHKNVEQT